jgi:hypothetical protein
MIFLFISGALCAEPGFSLMLTPEERGISQKHKGWTLNGILYRSDNQWTTWINGVRYTPGDIPEGFFILRVTQQEVEIDAGGEIIVLKIKDSAVGTSSVT